MDQPLYLDHYSNVFIAKLRQLPPSPSAIPGSRAPIMYEGGAYLLYPGNDYTYIPTSGIKRFGDPIFKEIETQDFDLNTAHTLNGRTLYGGPLFLHYGHLITESISRLWAFDNHDFVLFSMDSPSTEGIFSHTILPEYARDILRILKIPLAKVVIHKETPVLCSDLDIPQPGFEIPNSLSSQYIDFLSTFRSSVFGNASLENPNQRTFFSRSRLDKGLVAGEIQLERLLFDNGFRIVHTESLALRDQLRLISSSKQLVGLNGSALHNVLLSPLSPAKMIQFKRRKGWSSGVQTTVNNALRIQSIEVDAIAGQCGADSKAVAKFGIRALADEVSRVFSFGWADADIEHLEQMVLEEYDLLVEYKQIRDSSDQKKEWPPSTDKLKNLERLSELRNSPGIALFLARAHCSHGNIKQCFDALYAAHRCGASHAAISAIRVNANRMGIR